LLSRIQEADKKIIELHDDDNSEAIIPMLKHIYGLSYENQELTIEDNSAAILHLAVFMLGDKYDISSLRAAAAKLFNQILVEESQRCLVMESSMPSRSYSVPKLLNLPMKI
jgi:hypothetical protein